MTSWPWWTYPATLVPLLLAPGIVGAQRDAQRGESSSFRQQPVAVSPEMELEVELTYWISIKDSRNPEMYQAYLKEYPNGRFVTLAKIKLKELGQSTNASGAGKAPKPPRMPTPSQTRVEPSPQPTRQLIKQIRPGTVKVNPKDGMEYAWIPPGGFEMGCVPGDEACADDENPRHEVTISQGFWLGQTEVTVGAYKRFTNAMPKPPKFDPGWRDNNHPMVDVTWDEAARYCDWTGGRLPTEAEWEYAARGGEDEWKYPWGRNASHEDANYGMARCCGEKKEGRDEWRYTSPVASFPPNAFGLHDMAGNLWEWVADWYDDAFYERTRVTDPQAQFVGHRSRVMRGGSYRSPASELRVSARYQQGQDGRFTNVGFRCALLDFSPTNLGGTSHTGVPELPATEGVFFRRDGNHEAVPQEWAEERPSFTRVLALGLKKPKYMCVVPGKTSSFPIREKKPRFLIHLPGSEVENFELLSVLDVKKSRRLLFLTEGQGSPKSRAVKVEKNEIAPGYLEFWPKYDLRRGEYAIVSAVAADDIPQVWAFTIVH